MKLTLFCEMNRNEIININRGIEWSLRASASMRAVYLFLRARAFDKFVLRASRTLESRKPAAPMKYDKE